MGFVSRQIFKSPLKSADMYVRGPIVGLSDVLCGLGRICLLYTTLDVHLVRNDLFANGSCQRTFDVRPGSSIAGVRIVGRVEGQK